VQHVGELHHRVDVALERQREDQHAARCPAASVGRCSLDAGHFSDALISMGAMQLLIG
jgi:hypothetical protein